MSLLQFLFFFTNLQCKLFPVFIEKPDPPTNVVAVSYTARSVFLTWKPSFDGNVEILGYYIYQNDLDRENMFRIVQTGQPAGYTTTETTFNITISIIPYTKYVFVVQACNGLGCSNRNAGEPSTPIRTEPDGQLLVAYVYCMQDNAL